MMRIRDPGPRAGLVRIVGLALAASFALTGCAEPEPARDTSFDTWMNAHRTRADRGDGSWEAVHAGSLAALPFTRITLHRSVAAYFDFGDMDIVFADGERAERHGAMPDWSAPLDAVFVAEVPFHEYARLCWLIETLDLPRASQEWSVAVTHREQLDVSWTTRDGRTVELSDYGSSGPHTLHALAAAIESAARTLEWSAAGEAEAAIVDDGATDDATDER